MLTRRCKLTAVIKKMIIINSLPTISSITIMVDEPNHASMYMVEMEWRREWMLTKMQFRMDTVAPEFEDTSYNSATAVLYFIEVARFSPNAGFGSCSRTPSSSFHVNNVYMKLFFNRAVYPGTQFRLLWRFQHHKTENVRLHLLHRRQFRQYIFITFFGLRFPLLSRRYPQFAFC